MRFAPRALPGGDAAMFVRDQLASMPTRYEVIVDVKASAGDVKRLVGGWGTVEDLDDRSCRLRMAVDTLDWPTMVLASVEADFEVIEPPELRDHVGRLGRQFVRAGRRSRRGNG
jgi:predicted DNA-binding transcriptional regulator YafY